MKDLQRRSSSSTTY